MRWITELGIPIVTASNVSDYDLSDLEIFDANLTAQEMATMDAYGAKPPPPPSNCQAHPSCVPPPGGWTIAGCVNQGCQLCRASGNGTAALGRAEGDPTCDYGSCGCSKCCSGSAGPCKLVKDWYCSL